MDLLLKKKNPWKNHCLALKAFGSQCRQIYNCATTWQNQQRLIRLGWSESSLGAHSSCWFYHAAAQLWKSLCIPLPCFCQSPHCTISVSERVWPVVCSYPPDNHRHPPRTPQLLSLAAHRFPSEINWTTSQENLSSGFATRVESNRPVQPQKLGRGLKF